MRAHVSWLVVLVGSGAIVAACAEDDSNKSKLSRPNGNRGGTANGSAGRNTAGTTTGQAGSGGDGATMGMAGDNGAGTGAAPANGGTGNRGSGGGAGESAGDGNGARGGRGGTTSGGRGGSSAQAGDDAGGSGGEAGAVSTGKGLFIGVTGSDTGSGERTDPFATLAHAASVAESGDTIVFLDGTFDFPPALAVVIPDGVNIAADHAGSATLNHTGGLPTSPLIEVTGTSAIDGIDFVGFGTVIRADSTDDAKLTITSSSFSNCYNSGTPVLDVLNTAQVYLDGTEDDPDWGNCPAFATVSDSGSLNIAYGTLHYVSAVGVTAITLDDEASLALSHVTATDGSRPLLLQYGSSTAAISDSTIKTLGNNVATLNDQSTFTLSHSDLSIAPTAPFAYGCIQNNANGEGAIVIANSYIHHCSNAVNGVIPAVLNIVNSEIYSMSFSGLEIQGGNSGVITISGSSFHDITTYGMRLFSGGGGSNIAALTVRNTTFTNMAEALRIQSAPGSTTDLGTMEQPGGNTFQATTTGLTALTALGTFISAVGNTWVPLEQSADASGHYTAAGGTSLEVSTPGATGRNYSTNYGATIRLAQSP
jgi:hypothetical protein